MAWVRTKAWTLDEVLLFPIMHSGKLTCIADLYRKQVPKMNKLEAHKQLTEQLVDTYVKKNADYGDSFGKMFQELGIITAITRIGDKFNRIKALVKNKKQQVSDETIEDTLLDMANYCIMTVIELRIQKSQTEDEKIYIPNNTIRK